MLFLRCLCLSILLILILVFGCGTDTDDSINPISELSDIDVELETNSYEGSNLPEITSKYKLDPGMYKMRVAEALICSGEYIYFQQSKNSDGKLDSVRIYLDPLVRSHLDKNKTVLQEHTFGVVVEIVGSIGNKVNPCTSQNFSESGYLGRMVSIFEHIK